MKAGMQFHYETYRSTRREDIDAIVGAFPLAMVVSATGISHIPLFRDAATGLLSGHADAANPQFAGDGEFSARLVFMGPDSYIPPEAYVSRQLPTWNYVAVHMHATVSVLTDLPEKLDILRRTAQRLQPHGAPYQFDADDPRVQRFAPHIAGLRVRVLEEEARIKLSQDKAVADQMAALKHMLAMRACGLRPLLESLLCLERDPHAAA